MIFDPVRDYKFNGRHLTVVYMSLFTAKYAMLESAV